jgi:hypothetical protein
MSYTLLGKKMGRFSKFCRILAFFVAWWSIVDMTTDGFTVSTYKMECEAGTLPCIYWQLGVLFIVLPTLVSTVVVAVKEYRDDDDDRVDKIFFTLLFGLGYALVTPVLAIITTGRAFCCGYTDDEEDDKKRVSTLKLLEVVFEALPQVSSDINLNIIIIT